jgi:lipoprotein NlpD
MHSNRYLVIVIFTFCLAACSTSPPAPVIDRLPGSATTKASKAKSQYKTALNRIEYKAGDWRPDSYTVKKSDTLFSIGLEFGYDYKEIAQTNDIAAPYPIRIGQTLKLKALKDQAAQETNVENSDGVMTFPISNTSGIAEVSSAAPAIVALREPRAIREPYSDEALKKPVAVAKAVTAVTLVTPPSNNVALAKTPLASAKPEAKTDTNSAMQASGDINWAWPTKGKVVATFNEASNKGIDIAGSSGQTINAAANGKVIYSGSDLRGYGKLVIIKHNATYLSVYAHNSLIVVKEGQQVSSGEKIAEMGNTDSSSVKLHFEIRRQGKSVDPSKYLTMN